MKTAILLTSVLGLALLTISTVPAFAAVDMFLKIDGIPGESTDQAHKDQIEILSWSWGASMPISSGSTGGSGAGKVQVSDLSFQKFADSTSPKILEKLFTGAHIPKVELSLSKLDGKGASADFYKITLENVLVSSYNTGGSSGSDLPVESLSLNFQKITFEFKKLKSDGTLDTPVTFGWDIAANKKI